LSRRINILAGVGDANGDVQGFQQQYSAGITPLRNAAKSMFGKDFPALTTTQQLTLFNGADQNFVSLVTNHAAEGMYGNPEYGGNRPPTIDPSNPSGGATGFLDPTNRPIGWQNAFFEGDTQPHGYTTFVPDGPPDASGSATGQYVEIPTHPMSTADPGGVPLVLDPATVAAIQAALTNIRIG
jgi:hypothetical protein